MVLFYQRAIIKVNNFSVQSLSTRGLALPGRKPPRITGSDEGHFRVRFLHFFAFALLSSFLSLRFFSSFRPYFRNKKMRPKRTHQMPFVYFTSYNVTLTRRRFPSEKYELFMAVFLLLQKIMSGFPVQVYFTAQILKCQPLKFEIPHMTDDE